MIEKNYTTIISLETYHEWIAVASYYIFLKRISHSRHDPPPEVGAMRDWKHGVEQIDEFMRERGIAPGTW